jgi:hypothetical protein
VCVRVRTAATTDGGGDSGGRRRATRARCQSQTLQTASKQKNTNTYSNTHNLFPKTTTKKDPAHAPYAFLATNILAIWLAAWWLVNHCPFSLPGRVLDAWPVKAVCKACTAQSRALLIVARVSGGQEEEEEEEWCGGGGRARAWWCVSGADDDDDDEECLLVARDPR